MEFRVSKQKVTRSSSSESLKKNLTRRKKKKSQSLDTKKIIDLKAKKPQENIS
jgi:hypothetical protein